MKREVREETPRGRGAVSVVRVRGEGALADVARLGSRTRLACGVPHLVRLRVRGDDLDEALVCALAEDDVEVHLHGSPVLVRALIGALSGRDPAPTAPARNTAEDRARDLLARAPSDSAARILLDQCEGAWRRAIERLARADEPPAPDLARLSESTRVARLALEPARIVLAGPVNAGKSTLFNVLAGERRALTSDEPGTTRDLVRARVPLAGYAVDLVDTAGEREADAAGTIERAGQERARAERSRADLVLWLSAAAAAPAAAAPAAAVPAGTLHVWTCADRVQCAPEPSVSALRDPAGARATIAALFRARFDLPEEPWEPGRACAFDERSRALLLELVDLARTGRNDDARSRARSALRDL